MALNKNHAELMTNDAYRIAYKTIDSEASQSERHIAFGEDDIGQHSWTRPQELLGMIKACRLDQHSSVLDLGCGAGGPALFIAAQTGCRVTGLDIDMHGIRMANALAIERKLSDRCQFHQHSAPDAFDIADKSLDLVFAIDSMFHIPGREALLRELWRVLKDEGRLFFTDAGVVNGQLSGEEIQLRSFNGAAFYAPPAYNPELLEKTGFELIQSRDLTTSNAQVAQNRFDARKKLADSLIEIEGEAAYHGRQAYLLKTAELCREKRLCRYSYLAGKAARSLLDR